MAAGPIAPAGGLRRRRDRSRDSSVVGCVDAKAPSSNDSGPGSGLKRAEDAHPPTFASNIARILGKFFEPWPESTGAAPDDRARQTKFAPAPTELPPRLAWFAGSGQPNAEALRIERLPFWQQGAGAGSFSRACCDLGAPAR